MRMDVKFVFFILMPPIVLLEAEENLLGDLQEFFRKMVNYLFPKDPGIMRVRKLQDVRTVKNVTTLDFIGLVERYGYPAEEHYLTTEDGYNLVIHRISESPLSKDQQKRKVVFLQHGGFLSSDSWVLFGADKDLGGTNGIEPG
ncbi:PREDICTED: lysosomal acid lipase/cholesteryl ester hydrolase-like isoform X2 [Wasmannia auropunctata]|uniref:lysosomal acid lipase/cholesteryl ester hydrolase-like isoform X2 n=1 Tax=Wasmannia auropunctata TaxID=64793 RepID=UPI0005F0251F|nr:PREDICTED: lysosomal acid lipase/cholesteryl ester hydrolase-like isoform X2 [Wasmannia auropunctata]